MIELEQLKKRVAELEEKLKGKKKGGLKFKVPCPRIHVECMYMPSLSLSLSLSLSHTPT